MPRIRIAIDASLFSAISDEEKTKIEGILKNTTLLAKDGKFEGEAGLMADAQSMIADPQGFGDFFEDLIDNLDACKIGCDVAASAAAAACTAGTAGVGLAACLAGVEVARNACRSAC
ncbi:MAG: hypothetical protein ACK5CA_16070 [Cyanobacteriota bacterium]|jgi:hypothetical protein